MPLYYTYLLLLNNKRILKTKLHDCKFAFTEIGINIKESKEEKEYNILKKLNK